MTDTLKQVSRKQNTLLPKRKKVYFLPGTMCDERLWHLVTPLLDKHIEPVFLSIENHQSLADLAQSLADKLPKHGVDLVGFSLGGYIASYFTSHYANRVARLAVIANSPCALNNTELAQRKILVEQVKTNGYQGISSARINAYFDHQTSASAFVDLIQTMDKSLGTDTFISQLTNTSEREDLSFALTQSKVPTLFCYSVNDPLINYHWLSQLVENSKHCSQIIFQGKGHMLPLEQSNEIAQQLNQWLTRAC